MTHCLNDLIIRLPNDSMTQFSGVSMSVAGVLGTGSALPEKVITNADLEKLVDTSDQWITDRTGIRERRQAAPHEFYRQCGRPRSL